MPPLSHKTLLPFLAHKLGLFDRLYLAPVYAAISKPGPLKILVLCKGNICRSAYAQERLSQLLCEFGPTIGVRSAGLWTRDGRPADEKAQKNALARGIDLSGHLTTAATEQEIAQAGLILMMDSKNRAMTRKLSPEALRKSVFLGALDPSRPILSSLEIKDPYGKDDEAFESCFAQIDRCLEELVRVISNPPTD